MTSIDLSLNESLNQLRIANNDCDVIFKIGSNSFPAHQAVLLARMDYFWEIFVGDNREAKDSTISLDSEIIDWKFFDEFLNYVYTFEISLNDKNIRAIYKIADHFRFVELINKVKKHMIEAVIPDNAVLYNSIAEELNLTSVQCEYGPLIIEQTFARINECSRRELIPNLSFNDLKKIEKDFKKNESFENAFHYSIDWVLYDKVNRSEKLLELLENIPLRKLTLKFLKQVACQNELIRENPQCVTLLLDTIFTLSDSQNSDTNEKELEVEKVENLYVFGGMNGVEVTSVSKYDRLTQKWFPIAEMPSILSQFGCAVIGHKVYICGGSEDQKRTNELTSFDTHTRTWTKLAPMKFPKWMCAAAVLNEQIYVAGGWNDTEGALKVVERYCVKTDQWTEVAPLCVIRVGLELIALNGFLYAIGGCINIGNGVIVNVERYDPQTGQWTVIKILNGEYRAFGSAVLNGKIYIVEGKSTKCEVYSPEDDKWTEMPPPSKCKFGKRLAACDGKLYAIGGQVGKFENMDGTKTVEVFNFETNAWQQEPDMDVARCYHRLAVTSN